MTDEEDQRNENWRAISAAQKRAEEIAVEAITPEQKRSRQLMLTALHRPLTESEREELVALLVPQAPISETSD